MMRNVSECFRHVRVQVAMLLSLIADAVRYVGLCMRPSPALAAENLFLRKQLALYQALLLDSGVLCYDIARGSQVIFKILEK